MSLPPDRTLLIRTTTTLGDTPEFGPTTVEWPVDQFAGFTLDRLFANSVKVTVEKDDGTVIIYEPRWAGPEPTDAE